MPVERKEVFQVGEKGPIFDSLGEALGYQAFLDVTLLDAMLNNRVDSKDPAGYSSAALACLKDNSFQEAIRRLHNFIVNFPSVKPKRETRPEEVKTEVFYQLLVNPEKSHYSNAGQLKQFALYPADSIFIHNDERADLRIDEVAGVHSADWKRLELYFSKDLVVHAKP